MNSDIEKIDSTVLTPAGRRGMLMALAAEILSYDGDPWTDDPRAPDEAAFPAVELAEASEMAKAPSPYTLHTLTSKIRTCGVVSPTRIGVASIAPNSIEKVAAATFAASDAVLAVRDLNNCTGNSRDNSECSSLIGCKNMAGRVKEPQAMLIVDLGPGHDIKNMNLINSAVNIGIESMDDAARLVACPWVTVVLHRTAADDAQGWFTLDTSLVQRDLLSVTEKMRETLGAAPAAPLRPAATPESMEQLRKELNERLDKMEKTIASSRVARAPAPMPSSAAAPSAPPAESHTVLSLRASVLTLKRLTGNKRSAAGNGNFDR